MKQQRRIQCRAFTLIELVITMTVSTLICGSAALVLWNASKFRYDVAARADLVEMGSAGLERMVRYIREIEQNECVGTYPPCLNGNAQISTASDTSIRFGIYGFQYNSSAGTLEMTINSGTNWYTLATDVTGLTLAYWNRAGTALTSFPLNATERQSVRRVQILLELTRGATYEKIRTSVYLRDFINEVTTDP